MTVPDIDALRVLHLNDVAGVATAAVELARADGLPWRLWPLPAVRGAPVAVKAYRRAVDLIRFRPAGRSADLLHVHYGLFGYYAWSVRRPYLMHLHGTDVRVNLLSPALGPLVRRGIRRAGAVVYSTPDLAEEVLALRPDAVWIPAPLGADWCAADPGMPGRQQDGVPAAGRSRVVFASRWDPVKGLDVLLRTATRLHRARPDLELVGIDWGSGAADAAAAGVRLCPVLSAAEFRALLASADVVVGQQADRPLMVLSDLEAMALGRPLVARFTASAFYGGEPPLINTARVDPVEGVLGVLADPHVAARTAAAGRSWALRHHSPQRFLDQVKPLYRRVVAGR